LAEFRLSLGRCHGNWREGRAVASTGGERPDVDVSILQPIFNCSLPIQFGGTYEYNFQDDYVAGKWTIDLTAMSLFPL
jgi:hypothetical protein